MEALNSSQRFGFCEDYIQKYDKQILNDQEYALYASERLKVQALGSAFAISMPFTMIYIFTTKYDMSNYPKMARNLGILGGLAFAWMYVRKG
jgi:hypothetical protein